MKIESVSQLPSQLHDKVRADIQSDAPTEVGNTYNRNMQLSEKEIKNRIEQGNRMLVKSDTRLEVSFHKETNQMMIKLIDTQTNEVVKEIPPEKWADLVYNLCEQMGIFVDIKVGKGGVV
ncbi:flagellar protein FlaG [Paenibacillus sp. sgz5001063]|uniref:flagellar protein FlaG n=1 Tax=Paenibacillus sp. sgz5001063 TaxID=3242474 RepID=UPI0036D3E459